MRQRVAAEQSDAWSRDEGLREMREQAVSLLRKQEARIDGRIAETVAADATLRQRAEWIASIPGFGATALAGWLVERAEELGAAARTGLHGGHTRLVVVPRGETLRTLPEGEVKGQAG